MRHAKGQSPLNAGAHILSTFVGHCECIVWWEAAELFGHRIHRDNRSTNKIVRGPHADSTVFNSSPAKADSYVPGLTVLG